LVAHGKSPESLLISYNEEREPVAKLVLTITDRLTRMATMQNALGRQVRDALLPLLTGIHTVEDRVAETMAEIGIHYRLSSIVSGYGGQAPRAGDRAPDCEFCIGTDRQPVRLYEMLREPIHYLLIFVDNEPNLEAREFCEEIARDFAGVVKAFIVTSARHAGALTSLLDADGAAHAHCSAEQGAIVLIRPDGYIGFRGEIGHREAFRAYLEKIFGAEKSRS
jgi:aromatic ring hydroxylase-like protein